MISLPDYKIMAEIYTDDKVSIYRGHTYDQAAKPVIIKILKAEYPTAQEIAQFQHEYDIIKALHLTGSVESYALKKYDDGIALILEDVGGSSLKEIIAETRIDLMAFLKIAIQLAHAISELHQHTIIHKDIKPANIIVNLTTEQVKITDFSISAKFSDENMNVALSPNQLEGTLPYMSPEQTGRMNRQLDYRTDFYSLGVTFYEMLVGWLPFQTLDPMELVHCHIAKLPKTPHELNPDIPLVVSNIIMKLMAKNPEERYQSAYSLKKDLQRCLQALDDQHEISAFSLGQHDTIEKFQLLHKLYGRDEALGVLHKIFTQIKQGKMAMVIIRGEAGMGKTALVQEFKRQVVEAENFFIHGQFSETHNEVIGNNQENLPYSAILQALQALVLQLLTASTTQITLWKKKILAALGNNAAILVQMLPELEMLIGQQPPVDELSTVEAHHRFSLLFEKFIYVFSQPAHPLILFLEDLQWADTASLKLLQQVLTAQKNQAFFLIGSHRHVLNTKHTAYFDTFVTTLRDQALCYEEIHLTPLKLEPVNQLIADILHSTPTETQGLAELVYRKTEGHPFFIGEFLKTVYQKHYIWFNADQKRWHWDIRQILAMNMTDNVLALTGVRLHQLSIHTQEILKIAACIGVQFDLKTLSYLSQYTQSTITEALWEAIEENLIDPQGDTYQLLYGQIENFGQNQFEFAKASYRFVHDRIRQAAYALLSAEQKQALHYQLGQHLRESIATEHLRERLFEIVDHLNLGKGLMTKPAERHDLARLNLTVGKKAKLTGAYQVAFNYFYVGLTLLSPDSWDRHYQLALALHLQTMETAYLTHQGERANKLFSVVLHQANSLLDQIKAYEQKILSYIADNHPQQALDTGLYALQLLNIQLPKLSEGTAALFTGLQTSLAGRPVEQLVDLPPMKDPHKQAALRILVHISAPTYIVAPKLYPLLCFTQVKLCIEYGHSPFSAHAYAAYSLILCGVLGQTEIGYRLGTVALTLLERHKSTEHAAKVLMLVNAGARHWQDHVQQTLEPLKRTIQIGLDSGDVEYACYAAMFHSIYTFLTGETLEKVQRHCQQHLALMSKFNQQFQMYYTQLWQQLVLNLRHQVQHPCRLSGEGFDEDTVLPILLKQHNSSALFSAYLVKTFLCYLFRDFKQALTYAESAERYFTGDHTFLHYTVHNFYYSLILLANYPKSPPNKQADYLKRVQKNQLQLLHWSRHAPANYRHKYDLVNAERARVLGKIPQAMSAYERAIIGAKQQNYLHESALANELAAMFYTSLGIKRAARVYLTDAYYAYLTWGAQTKVKALEADYPFLIHHRDIVSQTGSEVEITSSLIHSTLSAVTAPQNYRQLDSTAIIKASQAISGEIVLEQLIKKLLHLVIENAGAQRGLLMLEKQGQLCVEAEAHAHQVNLDNEDILLQSIPLETLSEDEHSVSIPIAVINYVVRTQNNIVLNDAVQNDRFMNDPYIKRCQPKSILCLPLLNKSHLVGVLYLENNLITEAFTTERLNILQWLSTQMAISIENALIYAKLEQTREAAEAANRAKSAFLMNMSHELRTPLNAILGYTDIIQEDAEDMGYENILLDLLKIQTAGKQLLGIISNVLDISKIEADKMGLNVEVFEVNQLLNEVITVIQPSIGRNQLNVVPEKQLGTMRADRTKVQQILLNLLSNAIKFTSQGTITLKVNRYQNTDEQNKVIEDWLQFEIADTGIGMTTEQIEHVFEAFNQVDNSTTRQYGGTGLGLTISDRFCRMMGGKIIVNSQIGQGSTFTVQLPSQTVETKN